MLVLYPQLVTGGHNGAMGKHMATTNRGPTVAEAPTVQVTPSEELSLLMEALLSVVDNRLAVIHSR